VISALRTRHSGRSYEKGANGFLNKPFTDRQLNEAIADLIESKNDVAGTGAENIRRGDDEHTSRLQRNSQPRSARRTSPKARRRCTTTPAVINISGKREGVVYFTAPRAMLTVLLMKMQRE